MVGNSILNSFLIIVLAFFLASCSSPSIGLKNHFNQVNLSIGTTTKSDVIKLFGLPKNITKENKNEVVFVYASVAKLVGMCIGCGHVNGYVGSIPASINESSIEKNTAYFVFNEKDLLTKMILPKK